MQGYRTEITSRILTGEEVQISLSKLSRIKAREQKNKEYRRGLIHLLHYSLRTVSDLIRLVLALLENS